MNPAVTTKRDGTKLHYGLPADEYFALSEADRKKHIKQHNNQQEADRLKRSKAYAAKVDSERKAHEREVVEQRRKADRERIEATLRSAFLAAGGTEAEFVSAKDRLIREAIEAEATKKLAETNAAAGKAIRSNF